jgi:ABC-type lipoprotein export system ATPase subunit
MRDKINTLPLKQLISEYNYAKDFFNSLNLNIADDQISFTQFVEGLTYEKIEDIGLDKKGLTNYFFDFMLKMEELTSSKLFNLNSITIIGGFDKSGNKEDVNIILRPGDVVSIVGPTGSGKSRLLADIECLAQGDTPTGRKILINGEIPTDNARYDIDKKIIAQLSQNMNFVIDMKVREFVTMHAESRMVNNINAKIEEVIECANTLAGEEFLPTTPVTQLSGGQSRALMIADTAILSGSPIVLIDEIENAGVDRKRALEILLRNEKIVFISTHDPILALMGSRRFVIKNGGISKIVDTSMKERDNLDVLEKIDHMMMGIRNLIRSGEKINVDLNRDILELLEKNK